MSTLIYTVKEWYIDGGVRVEDVVTRTTDRELAESILKTRRYFGHDAWIEVVS